MYAIAFDFIVSQLQAHYPGSHTRAYYDVRLLLRQYGFFNVQGSVYIQRPAERNRDGSDGATAGMLLAMNALKALPWFPLCVRDIRVFRVDSWSDMTPFITGQPAPQSL